MLKGLLGRLRGTQAGERAGRGTESSRPSGEITVYDSFGREVRIQADEWRDKMLLPNVKLAWDKPDELAQLIISALRDGFIDDVESASARLLEIDTNRERAHVLRGIVLLKTRRLSEAATVLEAGMREVGRTGTLLTNLAKVEAEVGHSTRVDELLWESMQADPNQDNGLGWWLAIERERGGEAGYLSALERAAQIPGSWRPQLWLARYWLASDDLSRAEPLFRAALRDGLNDPETLVTVSGDLGNKGLVELMVQLIAPLYDPERGDPRAGLNLLQAYLQLGRADPGRALLEKLYRRNLSPFKQHLDRFSAEFGKLPGLMPASEPVDPAQLEVEARALDCPIWMYGLRDPKWLFAEKPADAPRVAVMAFAKRTGPDAIAERQGEDDIGRLTRSIPLYLAEAVHMWTGLVGRFVVPVIKGGGPVVFGAGGDDRALCDQFAGTADFLVTGTIEEGTRGWAIECRLWNCSGRSCLMEKAVTCQREQVGANVLRFEQAMLQCLEQRPAAWDAFYRRPSTEAMDVYLSALGQEFMLTLLAKEGMSKQGLWGERSMLEWPLHMALRWPQELVPNLMYIGGLALARSYGSDIVGEFRERTLDLIRRQPPGNPLHRLAPLAWRTFGLTDRLQEARERLPAEADPRYRQWLQGVLDE